MRSRVMGGHRPCRGAHRRSGGVQGMSRSQRIPARGRGWYPTRTLIGCSRRMPTRVRARCCCRCRCCRRRRRRRRRRRCLSRSFTPAPPAPSFHRSLLLHLPCRPAGLSCLHLSRPVGVRFTASFCVPAVDAMMAKIDREAKALVSETTRQLCRAVMDEDTDRLTKLLDGRFSARFQDPHCLFVVFHCLSVSCHGLSVIFHCRFLVFHRLLALFFR